jgi:hypothetical protein
VVFRSAGASRTWRYRDILGLTSESPFELTLASLDGETRFQLKQYLPEDRYDDLWRRINEANGLRPFHSRLENRK